MAGVYCAIDPSLTGEHLLPRASHAQLAGRMSHELQMFLFAMLLTSLTVVIHGIGMVLALWRFEQIWPRLKDRLSLFRGLWLTLRLVALVLTVHFVEAAVWGVGLHLLRIFPDFETAIYFSAATYTTVGYGDVVLPVRWRLLGPLEAMLGMLMFGWSTGVLFFIVMKLHEKRRGKPGP